mmetsp:Transcript_13298/g.16909  ORF Transcript_13298/g.16909 Transcript_13298/m.16909 type:complete len:263 (-) Transcript_13298:92-880(-)
MNCSKLQSVMLALSLSASAAFSPPTTITKLNPTKMIGANHHPLSSLFGITTMTTTSLSSSSSSDDSYQNENLDVIEPLPKVLRFRGTVANGYGRGGKKLGVPTANLPESLFSSALSDISTGVYFGWALIEGSSGKGRNAIQKAVVNVGYSPTFAGEENPEKIIEAHLILEEENDKMGDFYGEIMRLQLIGSLRPEMKFPSFPELLSAIQNDIVCAKEALTESRFVEFGKDEFLEVGGGVWIGESGGDEDASWEFQDFDQALL